DSAFMPIFMSNPFPGRRGRSSRCATHPVSSVSQYASRPNCAESARSSKTSKVRPIRTTFVSPGGRRWCWRMKLDTVAWEGWGMAETDLTKTDALGDFEHRQVTLSGTTKLVFVAGTGPAVIVMTEMPGISPHVARFARWIRDAGFTVWMPNLFGDDGRPLSMGYALSSMLTGCISAEFRAFPANASGPVTQWLRALAAHAHPLCGGKGVGAIGMCFTGNFALSMMLEPAMLAPVLSQPSLPLARAGGMHIAPDELAA